MAVHADLNLSHIAWTDSAQKFVAANEASLTGTDRSGRWTFTASIGDRSVTIAAHATPVYFSHGVVYSGGLRYDLGPRLQLSLFAGQDVGASVQVQRGADLQHYIHADASVRLF